MAAIVTTQAGGWSDTATWIGGVVPGNGDTVTLNHAVSVDVDTIIGVSPAATAITAHDVNVQAIAATANLTLNIDIKLTIRGPMTLSNCRIIQLAGSIYEFDASQATTPLSQNYYTLVSIDWNNSNTWWQCAGTSGNHCKIQSNINGGNGYVSTYSIPIGARATRGGRFDLTTFTDVLRVGTASTNMMEPQSANAFGNDFSMKNCTFESCGLLNLGGVQANGNQVVDDCNFSNSLNAAPLSLSATTTMAITDPVTIRSIQRNSFDKPPVINSGKDFDFSGCHFLEGWSGTNAAKSAGMELCFIRRTTRGPIGAKGDTTNCYVLKDGDMANPHWLTPLGVDDSDLSGSIFAMIGTQSGDFGDCIVGPSSGTPTVTIKNALFPEDHSTPVSLLGAAGQAYIYEHNTSAYAFNANETYAAHAGMISSFKSNISFGAAPGAHYMLNDIGGGAVDNIVAGANLDYNCGFNLIAGSEGNGINLPVTAAHSANSITADPEFVDSTRDIEAWDASLGGPGTVASAVAELAKLGLSTYNSDYNVADLNTFHRGGFAPQNTELKDNGHDSVTIGAVEFLSSASIGNPITGIVIAGSPITGTPI